MRDRTRHQLGVEIADNYGSTEAFIAWQCPHGSYHLNAEHVLIEIVDGAGRQVAAGETGKVLITTLENYLMPLVRYEIGDYAVASDGACSCGRTLPLIGKVLGRSMNLFRMADRSMLAGWNLLNAIRSFPGPTQLQIVQKAADYIVVRYVAEQPLAPEAEAAMRTALTRVTGPAVSFGFERVASIARAPSGKFVVALSEVSS